MYTITHIVDHHDIPHFPSQDQHLSIDGVLTNILPVAHIPSNQTPEIPKIVASFSTIAGRHIILLTSPSTVVDTLSVDIWLQQPDWWTSVSRLLDKKSVFIKTLAHNLGNLKDMCSLESRCPKSHNCNCELSQLGTVA